MTAIKKTTTKATKSPAPATKSAATAVTKTAAPKTVAKKAATTAKPAARSTTPAPAKVTTQAPVKVTTPAPAPVAPAAPTIKAIDPKPAVTTIVARLDIGFGNTLFVRGEGPGLSWDQGVAMACIAGDHWELSLGESTRPYAFKFLVNDLSWSTGEDYILASGQSVTLTPEF